MKPELGMDPFSGDWSGHVASSRLRPMGRLEVCDEGLQALAVQCVATSAQLATQVPTASTAPPAQATSAAVATAYAALKATAEVLADRVQETGSRLTTSASHYAMTEANSAFRIDALIKPVQT